MKRLPYERPTGHYDKQLFQIDEEICSLLKKRKEMSKNNPGFPPDDAISKWAAKYQLYEDYLNSIFGTMKSEDFFRPRVDPTGFRKHLPVLKSLEIGERLYSVTVIRQYENASVVHLHIDWDGTNDSPFDLHQKQHNSFLELVIDKQYDCRMDRGGGSPGHYSYNFIVSPPLPDDISGLDLIFKEYSDSFREKATGLEIKLHLK